MPADFIDTNVLIYLLSNDTAKARRAEANLAVSLATKLRLTPRSRVDKNIRLRTVPPGPKPWEIQVPPDDAS